MTRVLVTADHPFLRTCLAALVSSAADLELVGECGRGSEADAAVRRLDPHVVLMPVRSHELRRLDAARALHDLRSRARLLMLTNAAHGDGRPVQRVHGAPGYLARGGHPGKVLDAIRLVAGAVPGHDARSDTSLTC